MNAVLPFMHAWEEAVLHNWDPGVPEALYVRYSLLGDNEVTREMTDQLLPVGWHGAVSNARWHQGLLHLSGVLKGSHRWRRLMPGRCFDGAHCERLNPPSSLDPDPTPKALNGCTDG